ncbi:hypothetical protein BH11MYX3_BH11MYX3_06660 [soil metagenome]
MSDPADQLLDLEIKLAFQERLIRELDAHVRELGDRLVKTERELVEIKESIRTGGEVPLGPQTEKPPHY